ncbi:MAG: phosphomannomutase/phosphoglucomutase [Moraxellaceae bacterium]
MTRPPSRFAGKLPSLALHMALVVSASAGSYVWLEQQLAQQQQQRVQDFGEQAATLVELHVANLLTQTQLLAQQPDLRSAAIIKAVIPEGGTVPPSLSFAVQDLLHRTRTDQTVPELDMSRGKPMIDIAVAMPAGGHLVAEWSFETLAKDLERITPSGYQLRLVQQIGGSPVDALRVNSNNNDGLLKNIELKLPQWQLSVGDLGQPSPLPLWAALISLIGGLLSLLPWLLLARNQPSHAASSPAKSSADNNTANNTANNNSKTVASPTANPATGATANSPADTATDSPSNDHGKPQLPTAAIEAPAASLAATALALNKETTANTATTAEPEISLSTTTAHTESSPVADSHSMDFELDDLLLGDLELSPVVRFPYQLFRAYDVRGTTSLLDEALIERIGRALGATLRDRMQRQVVLGHDARLTSPRYAEIMRQALVKSGLTVIDIGQVPTPIMHFAAKQHDGNGIMITASHCDGDQNGIKWVIENSPPKPEDIQALAERADQNRFVDGVGQARQQSYTDAYIDALHGDVILGQNFEIAIDGMNGMMGQIAERVLTAAGCKVSGINLNPDGQFPNGAPDPSKAGQIDDLCNDVIISNADLGFAFDGDGDRLVVVDQQGQVVSPDQLIALFAQMILNAKPGADIIFDVKCSRMLSSVITQAGGRPVMVRSGNTFIRQAVQSTEYDAAFGAEFSGHYFFNDGRSNNNDDGLYAALRLLEWLDQQGQSIAEMLKALPQRVSTPDLYIPLDGTDGRQLLADLQDSAEALAEGQLSLLDGIRLDFNDGFGIIRASNTGPYLTARFDGETPEALIRIRQIFQGLISQHHPTLAKHLVD